MQFSLRQKRWCSSVSSSRVRARFERITKNPQSGFSLIELVVYSLVLALVLAIVGGMFISLLTTQRTVSQMNDASTKGQLAADSIETGIRNSSAYTLSEPTPTSQLLKARVARGTNTNIIWKCAAWYYTPADGGSIRYAESGSAITENVSTWLVLATGVKPTSGALIWGIQGEQLTIDFEALAGEDAPATISSSAVSRAEVLESGTCF